MGVDPVSLAVTAAMMAAQMALTASQKIQGPRLDDLNVSVADYGTPIPRIWGTRRIQPQVIWAEQLREVKKTSKTKGGKYTEYKYYGTWAVLLCDHEIDAVTRIWMDKRLVYQRTSAGPISPAVALAAITGSSRQIKLSSGGNMRVYLGTETQTQDPRIEAWCEDRYGPDSCPAYRGSAYIVLQDIPLETVGNRIPQLSVEVVNNKTDTYPTETGTSAHSSSNGDVLISPGGQWLAIPNGLNKQLEWWDIPTRTKIGISPNPGASLTLSILTDSSLPSLASDGTAYAVGRDLASVPYLVTTPPMGTPSLSVGTSGWKRPERTIVLEGRTTKVYTTMENTIDNGLGFYDGAELNAHAQVSRDFCVDGNGDFWGLFQPDGSSNQFTLQEMSGSTSYTFTGSVTRSDVSDARFCHVAEHGHFFVYSDGKFYIIDDTTFTVTSTGSIAIGDPSGSALPNQNPHSESYWVINGSNVEEYSLVDGSLLQSVPRTNWGVFTISHQSYDPTSHAIWVQQTNTTIFILYLSRVSSNGVTLQTVVDDVAGWAGLTGQDTSALTQTVYGYSIIQGAAKDMIQPLLDIYDVDARPHDFSVQFKVRGSSPSGSIATSDFVPNGDRYKVAIRQDTDIPRRVTINFADRDKDQQTNTSIAQRPLDAVDSNREETIDLTTFVDTPDGAQQKADRYLRREWNSRERSTLSLSPQKLAIEPGDVTTISLDGTNRNVRLDKLTISQSQLNCEFVRDETSFAAVNTATTGAPMDGRDDEGIIVPGPVKGIVIDGPFAEDVDQETNPILFFGAGPYGNGDFIGAVIGEYDGFDYSTLVGAVDTSQVATWGFANGALSTANANLWDRGNTVNISLHSGTLTSYTEAQINADPSLNLAALGADGRWEYIQFATASLQDDGTHTLSGLKRGRRGTEGNTANHATGDVFFMLDNRVSVERGASDIGDALSFKIESPLRDINNAQAIDLTYDAQCLKPYAPCDLYAVKDGGTGDVTVAWTRRTRLGGRWVGGSTIPLSEASESYEIDIYSGATFKRTLTSTSQSKIYTAAQIATDGTSSGFTANIYQMSATVGRGSQASKTFTL